MQEKSITISFKARYYQLGEISANTKAVWFVLHGYGQLAKYFLHKFKVLADNDICVIAPEGLSRFYLEDIESRSRTGNNRVGATWMTKEDRLTDIENYITYLTSVYRAVIGTAPIPATILGFSQGAATASRWAISNAVPFEHLILWAGILPPDMDVDTSRKTLNEHRLTLVHGISDPFLNDVRMNEMNSISQKLGITPSILAFNGGHEIDASILLKFI